MPLAAPALLALVKINSLKDYITYLTYMSVSELRIARPRTYHPNSCHERRSCLKCGAVSGI
jgi:hypothetical protein